MNEGKSVCCESITNICEGEHCRTCREKNKTGKIRDD
jgi:hypothetical protein